ncbi:PREDICTED: 45 kDa calcium-binding protein [Condylura cristata]|uniref:45 kDa calcium-binding protein n=1 Tax=Condylura cristata TaxID=143302 RepID=UPI0006434F1B|nr:PREDICTED: 45 kDa calcium-binding protein [Condylura cristata]
MSLPLSPAPATLAGHPASMPAAMASRQAARCGQAAGCLCLVGALLLMGAAARPANRSTVRERVGNRENEILPPDHLNGVKLEMDGHLNKGFHQEVFLGKDMDGFEEDAEPRKSRRKLMVIFSKVDVNTDRRISAKEMQRWIMAKSAEHFQEAVEENKAHFRAVDPDGDGEAGSSGPDGQASRQGALTRPRLQEYMDPMNEYSALNEAKQMIAIADENQNQHLEPEEVLKYSEFFTGSKLVDYARNVHEEF